MGRRDANTVQVPAEADKNAGERRIAIERSPCGLSIVGRSAQHQQIRQDMRWKHDIPSQAIPSPREDEQVLVIPTTRPHNEELLAATHLPQMREGAHYGERFPQ
jgi:hypothetical protein